jgi:hypothetical protein
MTDRESPPEEPPRSAWCRNWPEYLVMLLALLLVAALAVCGGTDARRMP